MGLVLMLSQGASKQLALSVYGDRGQPHVSSYPTVINENFGSDQ